MLVDVKSEVTTVVSKDTYLVRLPVFEGPLDLLLHLIEREKLDISSVSLAQVTDQFLVYIQDLEDILPGTLTDFLAMAARLVLLKSRLLLPQASKTDDEEEEDPGEALARQLREYKRFKEVSQALQGILTSGRRAYVRVAERPELERHLSSGSVTLIEFLVAIDAAFSIKPPAGPVDNIVAPFTLTIHDQIQMIIEVTARGEPVAFRALLKARFDRVEIIVTLLAVLELLKRRSVTVEQQGLFGEIMIAPAPDGESVDEDAAEGSGEETAES